MPTFRRPRSRSLALLLGLFVAGIPFFLLIASFLPINVNYLAFFVLLAGWAIVGGLCTRTGTGRYWSAQLAVWLVGIGAFWYALAVSYGLPISWAWLLMPVGLSLVLSTMRSSIPLFRTSEPKPAEPSYSQEYPSAPTSEKAYGYYPEQPEQPERPERPEHDPARHLYPEQRLRSRED